MTRSMKSDLKSVPAASADVQAARRVLRLEIEGIHALSETLDDSLDVALDLLAAVSGRIVVTGMGKSGLVGRKIAATLASVGTPALFVHPAEASHGDLGMITNGDAVLAISNSGETAEIMDVVAYTRRFSIPLVVITSKPESSLGKTADVALVLPTSREACPMGLAPTTSTTMTLALGDAIAVALLQRRGFSVDDFHVFHPGGKLGRKLLRVRDIMHEGDELPLIDGDIGMPEALLQMTGKRFGCIGIVDDERALVGIITDGDLRRHMEDSLLRRKARDIMTRTPFTIRPEALAAEALSFMNSRRISALFVVDGGKPVGIVHLHDVFRAGVV